MYDGKSTAYDNDNMTEILTQGDPKTPSRESSDHNGGTLSVASGKGGGNWLLSLSHVLQTTQSTSKVTSDNIVSCK